MLSTISRAGRVLSLFTPTAPEWGVREAAAALGLPRSNAHDLLSSLAAVGLLQRTDRGRYRLGWRLLTMSRTLVHGAGLEHDAGVVVRELAADLGETVSLGVWDGHAAVRLASSSGSRPGGAPALGTGTRAAGHATAVGKMLLAACDPAEVDALVDRHGLPRLTPHTASDVGALHDDLEQVRALGIAHSEQESRVGVTCVAVPVHAGGQTVAALSLSVPVARAGFARLHGPRALRDAARRLAYRLETSVAEPASA